MRMHYVDMSSDSGQLCFMHFAEMSSDGGQLQMCMHYADSHLTVASYVIVYALCRRVI